MFHINFPESFLAARSSGNRNFKAQAVYKKNEECVTVIYRFALENLFLDLGTCMRKAGYGFEKQNSTLRSEYILRYSFLITEFPHMKPELVVFDLDGVIADTEPLHREAKLRIMHRLGLTNSVDLDGHVGRPNSELWNAIIAGNGISRTAQELERMQYDSILDQFVENGTEVSAGLRELLALLERLSIPCAVCSSSDRYYVDRVLAYFSLRDSFSVIVGGDEVTEKKPAPDGYLLVLKRAGVLADHALAIEDTSAGIRAAVAAGIACIGYRNPTSGNQDLSGAVREVGALADIGSWVQM